jgi:hypothetical protein
LAPFCQAVSEEKIFLNNSQSETRIALGGHICWWNRTKWRNFIEDTFGQVVSEEKIKI